MANCDPGTMEESFGLMWTQWLVRYLFCTDQRCHSGDPHQSCNVNTCLAKSPCGAIMGEGLVSWWCQLGKPTKVTHQHEDHHPTLSFWPNFDLSSNAGISCLAFAHSSTTKPGKSWAWRIRRSLQRWQRMRQIIARKVGGRDLATHIVEDFSLYKWEFLEIFWMDLEENIGKEMVVEKLSESEKRSVLNPILCKLKKILLFRWRCFHAYTSVFCFIEIGILNSNCTYSYITFYGIV